MNENTMKHSKFINLVFIITSILIIWKVSTFFSSQFTDPTFQIGEFQLNVLFTIVGIFGGVVLWVWAVRAKQNYNKSSALVYA